MHLLAHGTGGAFSTRKESKMSIPVEMPSITSATIFSDWLKAHWHEGRGLDFYELAGKLVLDCGLSTCYDYLVFELDAGSIFICKHDESELSE